MGLLQRLSRKLTAGAEQKTYPRPIPFDDIAGRSGPGFAPWYRPDEDLENIISPEVKTLLSQRIELSGTALEEHILDIRQKAWSYGQYPAIGGLRFLRPTLKQHPFYHEVLSKLKSGASLLELGPGLGQDLQYLIADGAPSDKMYAVDSQPELWKLGRELFGVVGDKRGTSSSSGPHFITGDLIGSSWADRFSETHGQVDIILANSIFDTLSDAYAASVRRWLRPLLKPGTIIVGYQIGAEQPFESDGIFYDNRLSWWGSWRAISSENFQEDINLEVELWQTADLEKEWGLSPKEWNWIDGEGLHGVYWAVKRTERSHVEHD